MVPYNDINVSSYTLYDLRTMPELPEVETIRLFLEKKLIGKKIADVKIFEVKSFIGDPKKIIGSEICELQRKGKVLIFKLTTNNLQLYLNIHLKLTGQLLFADNKDVPVFKNEIPLANSHTLPARTTRVVITFDDNSALFFNDMRKFGWVKVTDEFPNKPEGIDVLSHEFTLDNFKKALSNTRRVIKTVLLDQSKVAGIGNIYANDSLWKAKIHPDRKTNSLNEQEIQRLFLAINEIINEGITYRGSSAKDELYILPDSEKGRYQNHFKTYHRTGDKCLRCGTMIEKMKITGRGTFFCPNCQSN